jgi:uncharacterized membrane protein YphA (DoxX/SURF4 family)
LSPRVLDSVGTLFRLGSAAVWLIYGVVKALDGRQFYVAIQGYQLLPAWLAATTAAVLPFVEIAFGLLLLLGLGTRLVSALSALTLIAFMIGIGQAWARGLTINCGCLGGGGEVAASETAYPVELLRDLGYLAMSVWLVVRPRTLFALDRFDDAENGQDESTPDDVPVTSTAERTSK